MKKKISYIVCDVCNQEIEEVEDSKLKIHKCDICGRDLCDKCYNTLMVISGVSKPFKVCLKCINKEEAKKEIKKFFNRKDIKEKMLDIEGKLKENIIKLAKPRRKKRAS